MTHKAFACRGSNQMAQVHVTSNLRIRRSFGKIKKIIEIPNLIEIQKRSYDDFLQVGVATDDRADVGLQAVSNQFSRLRISTRPPRSSSSPTSSARPSMTLTNAISAG